MNKNNQFHTFKQKKERKKGKKKEMSHTGNTVWQNGQMGVLEKPVETIFTFTICFPPIVAQKITPSTVMPVLNHSIYQQEDTTLKRQKVTHVDTFFVSHTPPSSPHTWHILAVRCEVLAKGRQQPFPEESPGCSVNSPSFLCIPSHTHAVKDAVQGLIRFTTILPFNTVQTLNFIYLSWHSLTLNTLTLINTLRGTNVLRNAPRHILQLKDSRKT